MITRTSFLLACAVVVLSGCQRFAEKQAVDEVAARLTVAEARVESLEKHLQSLENDKPQPANWVLWKRDQAMCSNCLYTQPTAISAYATRQECITAATRLVAPGGTVTSADPIEVRYGDERELSFHCLPPGIRAGVRTN